MSEALGYDTTITTVCSIDVQDSPTLIQGFKTWINNDDLADKVLRSESRCSLIALQTEMEMHIRLIERVMKRRINSDTMSDDVWAQIHHKAAQAIAREVLSIFKKISNKAGTFDVAKLNQELDLMRPTLAIFAKECLIKACIEEDKDFVKYFQEHVSDALVAQNFTSTTATGYDFLHSNALSHTLTRVSATDKTAHDKKKGKDQQALRLLHRSRYETTDAGYSVIPSQIAHREARVPSIAMKSGSHQAAVLDVVDKLCVSVGRLSCPGDEVVSYHLLTSLNTKVGSFITDNSNAQRASTARILKGSHRYNAKQLKATPANRVLVQNIPVNQHGNALSLTAFDDATREACLMTELSLLHTLQAQCLHLPVVIRVAVSSLYKDVMKCYNTFLNQDPQGNRYFKDSAQGKQAILALQQQKQAIHRFLPMLNAGENTPLEQLLTRVLFKAFAQNQHCHKQFGMLIQSLSIFLSSQSQAGCKSANERYQAVCGRVDLLNGMLREGSLSKDEKNLMQALSNYANNKAPLRSVQRAFDKAYSHRNLQASATHFSLEDQGGPSKLRASKHDDNGRIRELNTNVGESFDVDNLSAKHASPLQAHKADHLQALISCVDNQQQIQLSYQL